MFSFWGTAVNAVEIGEKLAVIEFHAARGSGVRGRISVAAFAFFRWEVSTAGQPPSLISNET